MSERLLRKEDIAAILDTNPSTAAAFLKKHGCRAIDFGRGRNRGPRWLESAVYATLYALGKSRHQEDETVKKKQKPKNYRHGQKSLAEMNVNELWNEISKESSNIILPNGQRLQ